MLRRVGALAVGLLLLGSTGAARAAITFSGAGTNPQTQGQVSGTAVFTISGNTLIIVLTNTGGATPAPGDIMTGVAWSIDPDGPSIALVPSSTSSPNPVPTAGSNIWVQSGSDEVIDNTISLGGRYVDGFADDAPAPPIGDFGVATTGFGDYFAIGGNIGGGVDYGIVAANTFPADASGTTIPGSQLPLVQNSVTFRFDITGNLTESMITGANLLYGTEGTGIITTVREPPLNIPPPAVPEPASLAIWSLGLGLAGFGARRRRKAA